MSKKAERKARKKAAAVEAIRKQEAARRLEDTKARVAAMPAEIPITWWEPTGFSKYTSNFYCECGARSWREDGIVPTKPETEWDRSPMACPACGKENTPSSQSRPRIMRCAATGEELPQNVLPAGAVWAAPDEYAYQRGPDGRSLWCMLPDGHVWHIDGQANNCTMPEDKEHRCWVRHGRPEDGTLHIDKDGNTCKAGAGSIATPAYHGFLKSGVLRRC